MPAERVLIVDDNVVNSKLASLTLQLAGYEVRTAADAEEALVRVQEFGPSLVLMDVQLPGIDGLELTRRLKNDPATRELIVVAMTSYAMRGDEEQAYAAGCDGYLAKPIDTRTFPATVAQYLAARSSQ